MIHIEVRDKVSNQKTYISTNVKILFEHHTKDGTIISSKHPNAAILRKNVQSIFNRIEAFVLSDKCNKFEDIQNWDKTEEEVTTNVVDFIRADLVRLDVSYTTLKVYNYSYKDY